MRHLALLGTAVMLCFTQAAFATIRFTVDSNQDLHDQDPADGVCNTDSGACTLRAAIEEANATEGTEFIEIIVAVAEIVLDADLGPLRVTRTGVTIRGPLEFRASRRLPMEAFGAAEALGAAVRGSATVSREQTGVGLVLDAAASLSGMEFSGFDVAVHVGSEADAPASSWTRMSHLAVHGNRVGIELDYGARLVVTSSALYDNTEHGIRNETAATISVDACCIGTLPDCSTGAGNGIGLESNRAPTVRNSVVSGNDVGIFSSGWGETFVTRCRIGTDHSGQSDVGNRIGIRHFSSYSDGFGTIEESVISGNDEIGVECGRCVVRRNLVGVDATGRMPVPNGIGIKLSNAGTATGSAFGNVVSGNDSTGVEVICGISPAGVKGNVIGLDIYGRDPLGNGGHGIFVPWCDEDTGYSWTMPIGGPLLQDRNLIAHNRGDGIRLGIEGSTNRHIWGVEITNNEIHDNFGAGIGLGDNLIEWPEPPVLDSIRVSGSDVVVFASFAGEPGAERTFEFYASRDPDPSDFGEGETPLERVEATTDESGLATVSIAIPLDLAPSGSWISATATSRREPLAWPGIVYRSTSSFSRAMRIGDPTGTDAEPAATSLHQKTALDAIFPNPASAAMTIPFTLSGPSHVGLVISDMLGAEVLSLVDGSLPGGRHEVKADISRLSAGVYFCVMDVDGKRMTRSVTVVR